MSQHCFRANVMALCQRACSRTIPNIITRCFATKDIIRGKNTVSLRSTEKHSQHCRDLTGYAGVSPTTILSTDFF